MSAIEDVYPGYDFILLDGVQNLPDWDLWIGKLYRRGKNLVITGSNAKMLSSEMATVLTGRYLQIEMLPFSLEETMSWKNISLLREEQAAQATMLSMTICAMVAILKPFLPVAITKSYLSNFI